MIFLPSVGQIYEIKNWVGGMGWGGVGSYILRWFLVMGEVGGASLSHICLSCLML